MRPFLIAVLVTLFSGCATRPTVDTGPRVDHWIEALAESDARLRKEAAFKLGNLGLTDPTRVVPALTGALQDADAAVRCEAIMALLKCGPTAQEAAGELADVRQNDRDPRVRDYAGKAMENLTGPSNHAAKSSGITEVLRASRSVRSTLEWRPNLGIITICQWPNPTAEFLEMYDIEFASAALDDLKSLRKFEQQHVLDGIESQLGLQPTVETRHRKRLRPNEIAEWELRIGQFRVFYNVDNAVPIIRIEAIGFKVGSLLFIRGESRRI